MTEISSIRIEQEIIQKLPVAVIVLDSNGYVRKLNKAARQMFSDDILHRSWLDIIQHYFIARPDDGYEISMINGRRVNVSLSSLSSLPGQLISITDVTETRNYQQQQETEKRLANIGQMTAQLAHQFRTPIASAMLYCDNLAQCLPHDDKMQRWLSCIDQSFQSMQQQINELLFFAKGQSELKKEDRLSDWLLHLANRLEHFNQQIVLNIDIEQDMYQFEMNIHAESLSGAIENLIQNAIEAAATEVNLSFQLQNQGIKITIIDNGQGMTAEMTAQAFEPFYSSKAKGTGLGLANVNAVVRSHGGRITLESSLQKGSCFQLLIPKEGRQ